MRMPANPLRASFLLPTLAGAMLAVAACSSSSSSGGAGADSGPNYGDTEGGAGGDGAASDARGEGGPSYDCSHPGVPVDTFMPNMAKDGKAGNFTFLLAQALPAPPKAGAGAAGKNTWTVKVLANGQPVTGEMLSLPTNTQAWNYPVNPLMAEHGTGTTATVKDNGDGTSTVVMNLVNPGIWWFFVQATDGTTVDSTTFSFCLP